MSNLDTIKNTRPFAELNEEELEKVSGGRASNNTTSKDADEIPHENISINFSSLSLTYQTQSD